jgi:hypothetical protein
MQSVFTHDGVTAFRSLFLVPLAGALLAAIALALFFHPPKKQQPAAPAREPVAA